MKKWENARQDEPRGNDPCNGLNILDPEQERINRKQAAASREILGLERYLKGLLELRKKNLDVPMSETVIRAVSDEIAKQRERYLSIYGAFPMDLEVA